MTDRQQVTFTDVRGDKWLFTAYKDYQGNHFECHEFKSAHLVAAMLNYGKSFKEWYLEMIAGIEA